MTSKMRAQRVWVKWRFLKRSGPQAWRKRFDEVQKSIKKVQKLFKDISDDVFLMAFGDHAEITATKKSIDVDEYEHD